MTDVTIKGGLTQDNAILLLVAAQSLDLDPSVVRTTAKGFVVPAEVAAHAELESYDPDEAFNTEIDEARAEVEKKPEPTDGVISAGEVPPTLDDEGNLVTDNADLDPRTDDVVPSKSASKGEWADYAKSQGETDDSLTKDALIEKYGNKE